MSDIRSSAINAALYADIDPREVRERWRALSGLERRDVLDHLYAKFLESRNSKFLIAADLLRCAGPSFQPRKEAAE